MNGMTVPLHMSVNYISFSAHSDFKQTSEFIEALVPPHVILVHGDANEMFRLKQALVQRFEAKSIEVLTPKNCQSVHLRFSAEKVAKIVGSLAKEQPRDGKILSGLIIRRDFNHHILAPEDLNTYTQLATSSITQRQLVPFHLSFEILFQYLKQMYDSIEEETKNEKPSLKIYDVEVVYNVPNHLVIEWTSNPVSDMIADSIVAGVLQLESNPTITTTLSKNSEESSRLNALLNLLRQQFSDAELDINSKNIVITLDGSSAIYNVQTKEVECRNAALKQQIEKVTKRMDSIFGNKSAFVMN